MLLVPFQKGKPTWRTGFRDEHGAGQEPPDVLAALCSHAWARKRCSSVVLSKCSPGRLCLFGIRVLRANEKGAGSPP